MTDLIRLAAAHCWHADARLLKDLSPGTTFLREGRGREGAYTVGRHAAGNGTLQVRHPSGMTVWLPPDEIVLPLPRTDTKPKGGAA